MSRIEFMTIVPTKGAPSRVGAASAGDGAVRIALLPPVSAAIVRHAPR
jgi:hypothetical protein